MIDALIKLYTRDLEKLSFEIDAFQKEENLWCIEGEIKNSAGNLCLHIMGNLNHFIGAIIGGQDYVRNREAEFADKEIPRHDMIRSIEATKKSVVGSLEKMDRSLLERSYPIEVFGYEMTYQYFLIHLVAHLNYHLGQINYLRRILE